MEAVTIALHQNFIVGTKFAFGVYLVRGKKLNVLFRDEIGKRVGGGSQIEKTAFFRFRNPSIVVTVAVENDALVFFDYALDKVVKRLFKVGRVF